MHRIGKSQHMGDNREIVAATLAVGLLQPININWAQLDRARGEAFEQPMIEHAVSIYHRILALLPDHEDTTTEAQTQTPALLRTIG